MALLKNFRKYFAIYKLNLQKAFVYRFMFAIWAVLHPLRLVVLYFLWKSIFEYSNLELIGGFTFAGIMTYYITQTVLDTFVGVDRRVPNEINKGTITTVFIRPLKYFSMQLMNEFANRTIAVTFHMLPTAIIAYFLFSYKPVTIEFTLFAMLASFLGLLLNFCMAFNFSLITFWTKEYFGIRSLKEALIYFFAGQLFPITIYPLFLQKIIMFTPFPYISFIPASIFVGKYETMQIIQFLGIQIIWIFALYGLYRFIWGRAKKKFTAVGL